MSSSRLALGSGARRVACLRRESERVDGLRAGRELRAGFSVGVDCAACSSVPAAGDGFRRLRPPREPRRRRRVPVAAASAPPAASAAGLGSGCASDIGASVGPRCAGGASVGACSSWARRRNQRSAKKLSFGVEARATGCRRWARTAQRTVDEDHPFKTSTASVPASAGQAARSFDRRVRIVRRRTARRAHAQVSTSA